MHAGRNGLEYEQVANVGDSAAVLIYLDEQGSLASGPTFLTADHRLSNVAERDRLQGLGITLGHGGTRLYGLNLGRCLGDRYLKVCLPFAAFSWALKFVCNACAALFTSSARVCSSGSQCRALLLHASSMSSSWL